MRKYLSVWLNTIKCFIENHIFNVMVINKRKKAKEIWWISKYLESESVQWLWFREILQRTSHKFGELGRTSADIPCRRTLFLPRKFGWEEQVLIRKPALPFFSSFVCLDRRKLSLVFKFSVPFAKNLAISSSATSPKDEEGGQQCLEGTQDQGQSLDLSSSKIYKSIFIYLVTYGSIVQMISEK